MEATNLAVLAELQEYAQLYFDAIKEHNTTDGVCELRPGNYSAKELADREKAACGAYRRPVGDIFDEEVSISVDTFRMRFPYREIFYILARWEAMCRPGKSLKSVFTVGDVEEKTAKVLLCEQTELGKYKAKGMKLQHLTGNWWAPRKLPKCDSVELVYELNGVMFLPGTQAWSDDISNRNSAVLERCAKLDDAKTTESLLNFIATQESAPTFGYFVEVARRAGINTANTPKSEQPAIPTETPQIVRVEIVRDFDGSYYANLHDANGNGYSLSEEYTDFCTLKTLCKKEYGVCLPNLSQIEFETHGRKSYAYISTETPQISTESAETVNVSAEGENAKNEPIKHIPEVLKEAEQNYQCVKSETLHTVREADGKWHTYFMGDEIGVDLAYDQINHIPAARTARAAEEVAEICRYINRLNGNHIADADYYLAEMREGIKQAEAARRKRLVLSSREDVLAHLDKLHGLEYDAGEVAYLKDGCTAEEHEDGTVWRVYPGTESDEVIGTYRIAPQSLEAPPTAKHPTPPPILGRRRRKRARRGAQAAPGLRSAPGMCAGGCGVSRHAGRREAPVTSHRCSVGISGMVHGGRFYRSALPRAGPPYTENQALPLQNNFV